MRPPKAAKQNYAGGAALPVRGRMLASWCAEIVRQGGTEQASLLQNCALVLAPAAPTRPLAGMRAKYARLDVGAPRLLP